MLKKSKIAIVAAIALSLTACQMPMSNGTASDVYSRQELSQAQRTYYGTLLSYKPIKIQGEGSLIATGLGAGLAGYGASHIGGGKAKYASAAVGAVLGGVLADALATTVTESEGTEFVVRLDKTKEVITFAQEGKTKPYRIGGRVKVVIDQRGKARIDG